MGKIFTKKIKKEIENEEEEIEEEEKYEEENEEEEENKSFSNINLIKHDDNSKYFLDIIWIDENVFNSENQSYFEKMKLCYPNIKINLFDDLEKGFNTILDLEFVSIFVIVSGRLYSRYYNKLKENLNKIRCLPINLIFTSSKFKKILENKEKDIEHIISYDIQKSINNSFYNSGGVFDKYEDVAEYLNKYNSNFSKKQFSGNSYNLSLEVYLLLII